MTWSVQVQMFKQINHNMRQQFFLISRGHMDGLSHYAEVGNRAMYLDAGWLKLFL